MNEDMSFFIASLVGVLLGIVTISLFIRHSGVTGGNDALERIIENKAWTETERENREEAIVTKETEFPADWFTSTQNFDLETRAIFSKSWIYLTHKTRFSKPGDYHSFTLSGFSIFLILGKDSKIRAFHNVCRHRAYTITRKESGSSTVLGCKYHGWSYDVTGRLVKAPMFDGVPGFRKEDNGLFEIPVRVSEGSGAVFINLDAARMSESEKKEDDLVDRFLNMRRKKGQWLDGRTVEGGFNWKHAVDPDLLNIGIPHMPKQSVLRSWLKTKPSQTSALHLFPNSTIYKIPDTNLWYSILLMPSSTTKTHIRWDLYSSAGRPNPGVEKAVASQIEGMISTQAKALENSSQIVNDNNKGNQHEILVQLQAHLRVEKTLGKHITPTMHKTKTSEKFLQAEILCKELDCLGNKANRENTKEQGILVW